MHGGTGWTWLFWLLLVVGLVAVVVVAVRAIGGGVTRGQRADPRRGPRPRSRARDVLDERYAAGELDTDEYRERVRALDGNG